MKNLNLNEQEKQRGWHDFCSINHANQTEFQADTLSASGSSAVSVTLEECPANHALITRLSRAYHALLPLSRCVNTLIRIGDYVVGGRARRGAGKEVVAMMRQKCMMWKYAAMVVLMLTLGVGEMWAWNSYFTLGGIPVDPDNGGVWTSNDTYRITAEGDDGKGYFDIYMETNETFCLYKNAENAQYGPNNADDQNTDITVGATGASGYYKRSCWVFKSSNQIVRVNINRKGTNDEYYPTLWLTKIWDPKDEINGVLTGNKVMFYYGDQWGNGTKYLFAESNHTSQTATWVARRTGSGYFDGSSWGDFHWAVASVASANYYVSNSSTWEGKQMGENAVAGKAYTLYNDNGTDKVKIGNNYSLATFTNGGSYSIEYGTANSGVSASCNNDYSVIGKSNSIYGYYISVHDANSWSSFNPSDADELAPGNYDVAAIVTDGLIYVKGATASLEVTETTYTVSVARNDNSYGTVSSSSVTAGAYTKPEITATPDDGYYFTEWTLPDGVTAADGYSATSNPIRIHASASGQTITANFAKRFVLRGSRSTGDDSNTEGMPGWTTTDADMEISEGVSTKEVTLYPNREYKFMIYDKQHGWNCGYKSENYTLLANTQTGSMDGTYHLLMNTAGYGTYRFSVAVSAADGSGNTWPKVTITNPSSWMITMGQKTETDGCWTPVDNEGGTIYAKTTEAETDFEISNGKYVRNGGTVTFTATPASGFMFDGWYDNSSCTGVPISTAREYAMENITSAKTVYAKFVEVTFTVNVFLGNDGNDETEDWQTVKVGAKSHPSITANTISDQVFDRWEVIGSATFGDAYSKTTTVSGVTDAQTTVVATHKNPPTLYYVIERPTSWNPSTMYVYFYSNDYWNKDSGSGSGYGCMKVAQMTAVDGKNNKWWKYTFNPETDPELSGNRITSVSFMEYQQLGKYNFDGNNTGTHRDYHSCMNMFIVTTTDGTNHLNGNTCWYYNDGYWYNYEDDKSGYYLQNLPGGEVEFIADANGIYSASVNLEAAHDYYFYIGGCDGKNWANDEHYTGASHEHTLGIFDNISSDANKVHFTTSAGGIYKFKLTPIYNTADNSAHMKLNIIYPVQANDYRARYNNAASSPTISRPSNTISSDRDHGAISLWLNKGANYITFEKATVDGSTGALTWTSVGTQQTVTDVPENGVYTMTLTRSGETYTVSSISPYTGDFYIRTDCASGGWKDYVINGMTNNTLTFDKDDASTFDYYYCKWIKDAETNVRFAVANDLNIAISDTLIHDAALGGGSDKETLPEAANVRFAWNSHTNTLSRAYLSGATDPNDRFLILHGNEDGAGNSLVLDPSGATIDHSGTYGNLREDEEYFSDQNDWVYQVELKAKSGAAIYLTAKYNGEDRPLYASSASPKAILTSSNTSNSYPITATYDFKTNNMLIAWHPGNDPKIEDELTGLPSVMVMREHQGDAEQITFNGGSIAGTRVYGVMNFNKWTLNNQDKSTHATYTEDASKSEYERSLFWISFPFDVRLKDVFGFGEYGRHWIIEYYDGAGRAKNGWWIDSDTNWKFVLTDSLEHGGEDKQGYILKANVGYVLALDLVELTHASKIWNNDVEDVYLYFPSISTNVTINNSLPESVVVPKHECKIERDDRQSKDCNWNVIGVPIYANEGTGLSQDGVKFFYAWDPESNELDAEGANETGVMHSMHAYMVQFAGTINWSTHTMTPASVAARRSENAPKDAYMFRLDLMQGGKSVDKTFVELSEDATISFDVNKDMTKMLKQTQSNIYTLVAGNEGNIQVAGNCLPLNTRQTTIVPVGVKILADGEFSFSMPEGTNGVGVILVDNNAGTRTNLSLTDYTIHLEAGQYDGRFLLEISPISNVATGDLTPTLSQGEGEKAHKVMVDGILYIVKDGIIYDARGNKVK